MALDQNPTAEVPLLKRYRSKAYRPTIREALLQNCSLPERERLTNKELAKKLGCRVASIWVVLSHLRSEGVLTPVQDKPAKDVPGPRADWARNEVAEKMLESALGMPVEEAAAGAGSDIMAKDERARRLSQIARLAPSNVSVLAVKALDEQERGSGLSVGPPDPLDRSERVSRAAKLLLALGKAVAEEALALAYPAVQAEVAVAAEPTPELRGEVAEGEA